MFSKWFWTAIFVKGYRKYVTTPGEGGGGRKCRMGGFCLTLATVSCFISVSCSQPIFHSSLSSLKPVPRLDFLCGDSVPREFHSLCMSSRCGSFRGKEERRRRLCRRTPNCTAFFTPPTPFSFLCSHSVLYTLSIHCSHPLMNFLFQDLVHS